MMMNETEVAQAIAAGEMTSPQVYENVALFDLRITGTGTAYRKSLDEHVYRPPENYLNDAFLARCNGLPVVLEHPESGTLDSDEFANRIIGTITLPYVKGDEVWGVAKMYDAAAVDLMMSKQMSTSPAVVFRDNSVNTKMEMMNGSTLLIEGRPSLLDHLAVTALGVWDKGGEPTGVNSNTEDMNMDEDRKTEDDRAKADADEEANAGVLLDKILKCVDSLSSRMDSWEEEDKKKADAARRDNEDDSVMDKRRDGEDEDAEMRVRRDSARRRKDAYEPTRETDEAEKAHAQGRADAVASAWGERAPPPMIGERPMAYRRRLVTRYQSCSPDFKAIDLNNVADQATFDVIEGRIYADAVKASANPAVSGDYLKEVRRMDDTGRMVKTYFGDPKTWMRQFSGQTRHVARFNDGRANWRQ